ncbi:hypothetical protein Tco_0687305 [Tanacetum coccineum]
MVCVRESINTQVRKNGENIYTRVSEFEGSRHIGTRGFYNGKHLGTNYTGVKRSSMISFMFFNFPEEWGMGKLWDVDGLLKQLQRIRFREEWLRVFVAYDRRRYNDGVAGAEGGGHGAGHKPDKSSKADETHTCIRNKDVNRLGNMTANKEGFDIHLEQKVESVRCIEIEDNEVNSELMGRSVVGEVKARYFLTKLSVLCEEQDLNRFEIKLLGGLEVMVVMENIETTDNVLKDREHGLRRWLHNLRRGDSFHRTAGRMTWINVLGVSISCWGETTFQKIAALHGTILGMHNCRLEGVMSDHVSKVGGVAEDKMGENDMQIDEGVGEDDGESNSECSEGSSNEEGEDGDEGSEDEGSEDEENGGSRSDMNSGNQNGGEDEGSRYSDETNVGDTFEENLGNRKEKSAEQEKDMYGEYNADNNSVSTRKEGPTEELVNNGYESIQKVRKASCEVGFDGAEIEKNFNQGKSNVDNLGTKNKVGRRSVKKATEVARKTMVEGLGENKKGISDAYKEYHKVESESIGIFQFGNNLEGETHTGKCNINIEQAKEVGELIGVSWLREEEEKKKEEHGIADDEDNVAADVQP